MKIYVEYKEECVWEDSDFNGEDFSGSYSTEYDYKLIKASIHVPKSPYHEVCDVDYKIIPQRVYVVLIRYSSGDTFGTSTGHGHIEKVCINEKDAQKIAQEIRDDKYSSDNKNQPWVGFFETLEGVEVITLPIQ